MRTRLTYKDVQSREKEIRQIDKLTKITKHMVSTGWFYPVILVLLVVIMNGPALGHTFIADDWYMLYDQAQKGFGGKLFGFGGGLVRPVGVVTWQILYYFFGFNAIPYNFVALLLQLSNTWLIYSIVSRLSNSKLYGFCAGIIFCTYYLGWEPTLWLASSFFDVQCTFFMLLTFRLFLTLETSKKAYHQLILLASTIASFGLAVFNKETGLLLWPILLFYDLTYWRIAKRRWWQTFVLYGSTLAIIVLFSLTHIVSDSKNALSETTNFVHLEKVYDHILYQLEGLYLFPTFPFGLGPIDLLKHELKFSLWLTPAVLLILYVLISFWQHKQRFGLSSTKANASFLTTAAIPLRLLSLGLAWTVFTSLATLPVSYDGLRFFYTPHIGVTFSFTALLILMIQLIDSLRLSSRLRRICYAGIAYVVIVLSFAGLVEFVQGNLLYGKSSEFVNRLTTVAKEQIERGASDITFVNLPQVIERTPGVGDYAFCLFDETDVKEVISLRLGFNREHIQVIRTGDFPQLHYFAVGGKIVSSTTIPSTSASQAVINVVQSSTSEFKLVPVPLIP